ncbi:MAG: hypothetical protein MPK30_03540 [Gammaproteobacteria bacterium]|nr:hypothetical protein [Gammaproteobacteria bacterium]
MPNTKQCEHVSREDVVKVILSGIQKAHEDYCRMSGGLWMWNGPEYWITTYVAKELWKLYGDGFVVAEANSDEMRDVEEDPGRTPVQNMRFDIALYFPKEIPHAVIEIKNQQQKKNLRGDVERVLTALNEHNLCFGALAYYHSAKNGSRKSAAKIISDYASGLSKESESLALAADRKCSAESKTCIFVEGNGAWLAGCILLEHK